MCAGYHLANRELYTILARLIIAFKLTPPRDPKDAANLDPIDCNEELTSLNTQPKPFKIGVQVRNLEQLKKDIARSNEKTEHIK